MRIIIGNDSNEYLYGTTGDDLIEGRGGDDSIFAEGGNDLIYGGLGNDYLSVSHATRPGERILADGGDGDDTFSVSLHGSLGGGFIEVVGGEGDDRVRASTLTASTALLTLGAGRDVIEFATWFSMTGTSAIVVTDFAAGADGDRIDWQGYLHRILTGWSQSANPFASGHLLLTQDGADLLVQIDPDGTVGPAVAATMLVLRGRTADALTAYNLGGYDPAGAVVSPQFFTGTEGRDQMRGTGVADIMDGLGGDDLMLGSYGNDTLRGGDGNDDLRGDEGDDRLEGGRGADTLQGGVGDDALFGGEGDDTLIGFDGGSDALHGEGGNDTLTLSGSISGANVVAYAGGGDGDDVIKSDLSYATVTIDAGAGADIVEFRSYETNSSVTLGEGRDLLRLMVGFSAYLGSAVITDFQPGPDGDSVDAMAFLGTSIKGWDGATNPFASGYFRLVQSGADTLLQVDEDGRDFWPDAWGPAPDYEFTTLLTFRNVDAATFTLFSGYATSGAAPAALTLTGTAGADTLAGVNGSDLIDGGEGDDTLGGGAGHDTLRGGDGADTITGDVGDDRLEGGGGADRLDGGRGQDLLYGGEGDDRLTSYHGPDELHGEAGHDVLTVSHWGGGEPADTRGDRVLATGGEGNDTFWISTYNRSRITVEGGAGADIVNMQALWLSELTITFGPGRDQLYFLPYYNLDVGTPVVTDFVAGPEGDQVNWNAYLRDRMSGWDRIKNPFAAGYAALIQDGADTLVQLDTDGSGTRVGLVTLVRLQNVDLTTLTAANFDGWDPLARYVIAGTAGADTLTGRAGRDALDGGAGNDTFRLEQGGDDSAAGGEGFDVFLFGTALTAADRIDGGPGPDQVVLQGSQTVRLGAATLAGVEQLGFLRGDDIRFGAPGNEFYSYDVTTHDGNVAAGAELVIQFNGLRVGENVRFDGSAELDGNFWTFGGLGTDVLIGGQRSDRFFFGADGRFTPGDKIDGQGGTDDQFALQGDYSGARAVVFAADTLTNVEKIGFLSAGDARFGNGSADGFDYDITTHDGNVARGQRMVVQANRLKSNGTLDETLVFDGRAETDGSFNIFAGEGGDTVFGGANGDSISGRGGNDRIVGGGGGDTLRGDAGDDVFIYLELSDSTATGRDTIATFAPGDRIDLSAIDALAGAGDDAFAFIGERAFTAAGQLRAVRDGANWLVEADVDGDGVADLSILLAPVDPAYTPAASDFVL